MLYLYDTLPVYHSQFKREERDEICAMICKTNRAAQGLVNECRENAKRYKLFLQVQNEEKGRGIHAQARISRLGSKLGYYTGKIHVYAHQECLSFMDAYAMQIQEFTLECSWTVVYPYIISASTHAEPFLAEFLNHSCVPNCIAEEVVFSKGGHLSIVYIKNTRPILRGQELVYHYGSTYFNTPDNFRKDVMYSKRLQLRQCLCDAHCANNWFLKDLKVEKSSRAQRKRWRRQERACRLRAVVNRWLTIVKKTLV
jgi:hypothetical protein